ncbi:NB-ARC domain-containing protein [Jatrophihabitans sp. YIM 134969]
MTGASGPPEPDRIEDLADLASHLDALRRRAADGTGKARVSLAALAGAVGIPRSTTHLYVTGRSLPPADVLDGIVIALGATPEEQRAWAEAWYRAGVRRDVPPPPPGEADRPPLVPWSAPTPRQLPPASRLFGRDDALRDVVDALTAPRAPSADDVPTVVLLHGLAGQGKTALGVRAAHLVADGYPDGQLYADLGGGPGGRSPADVLAMFLRALGVDTTGSRTDLDELSAAFRTATADRRLLIVLDNAHDEAQVLPLVPGSNGCATLVTSRAALPDLDVALRHRVAPLDETASLSLLAAVCGAERTVAEPAAAAAVVAHCSGLPLALRILGGRLATQPQLGLAELAARLVDEDRRVRHLASAGRSVHAGLRQTTGTLGRHAVQALNAAAAFGPVDFGWWLVAPLADVELDQAASVAEELVLAGVLEPASRPPAPSRYRLHDLVRAFAAPSADPAAVQRAVRWVLDLTAVADAAFTGRTVDSGPVTGATGRRNPQVTALVGAVRSDPGSWSGRDLDVAGAALTLAVRRDDAALAARLLTHLAPLLTRLQDVDRVVEAVATCRTVVGEDPEAAVRCDVVLGQALLQRSEYPRATQLLTAAAGASDALPLHVQADVWRNLGFGRTFCDDPDGAVTALRAALDRSLDADDVWGLAEAHRGLSVVHRETDVAAAVRHGETARELADATPDHRARSIARFGLARLALRVGDPRLAVRHAEQAWEIAHAQHDPTAEGWCSVLLADAHRAADDLVTARVFAQRAAEIADSTQRADLRAAAYAALGRVEQRRGDGAAAERWRRSATGLHRRFDSPRERRELRDGTHDHDARTPDVDTA